MKDELLRVILNKHLGIVEENFISGNYLETDFRHYSELVETLVDTVEKLNPSSSNQNYNFFTGLCLPLFQWFNFDIASPKEKDISKISKMQCDPIWGHYLDFVKKKLKNRNVYRCILGIDDGVKIDEQF